MREFFGIQSKIKCMKTVSTVAFRNVTTD